MSDYSEIFSPTEPRWGGKKHIPIINNIYINNKDHNNDNYRSGNDDKAFFQGNIINPKGIWNWCGNSVADAAPYGTEPANISRSFFDINVIDNNSNAQNAYVEYFERKLLLHSGITQTRPWCQSCQVSSGCIFAIHHPLSYKASLSVFKFRAPSLHFFVR